MSALREAIEPALRIAQPTDRLRAMDERGIDVEALSISPFWYTADRDVARTSWRGAAGWTATEC